MDSLEALPSPPSVGLGGPTPLAGARPPTVARPDAGFAALLARVGSVVAAGEALVERAAAGPAVTDPARLIALQVGVYRYAETIELVTKVVEGASTAVRTTLQST